MENQNTAAYIGIDLESTGLDTRAVADGGDRVLEIAVILVAPDLSIIDHHAEVIDHAAGPGRAVSVENLQAACSDYVRGMHTDTGLWHDLTQRTGRALPAVEEAIVRMLAEHGVTAEDPLPLLGSSPGSIDRPMVARDFPRLTEYLTYRTVDASTLTEIGKRTLGLADDLDGPDGVYERTAERASAWLPQGSAARPHRALWDIARSAFTVDEMLHQIADSPRSGETATPAG